MSLTIESLGHAGFLLTSDSLTGPPETLAIDPFLTGNPAATKTADQVECAHIAVTHGHADHYSDVPAIAKRTGATVYAAFEICNHLSEQGHEACEPMNPGGKVTAPFGWVALTQAFHSSSFEGRYMGMPCGVIASIGGVTVYHMGDTALFGDLKLLGEIYQPDVVIVPVGDRFTMGPETGAIAAEMVDAKIAIPCHYGTWPVLAQDISAFAPKGVEVRALKAGEKTTIG